MTDSKKTTGSPVDEMDLLKELILGEEKDRLNKLDHRISDLESRTADLTEVLPAAMNRLVSDPAHRPDFERPVVDTIRSAIKRDTHTFAEALFPVLGPAIRRAVADALKSLVQRINIALENSFTVKGLRWRMEAARTGVPFAQIVLRHTMLYSIQEAFLIQRGSGLVLASVQKDATLALDEDAVASMLTAIQSFIQDSFGASGDEPLRSAELGDQTMWVINGPVAALACVISGTPPRQVRDELMDLLETLHARFGSMFRDAPELLDDNAGLQALMNEALREEADQNVQSSTRFRNRILWVVASFLLLTLVGYSSWRTYQNGQFRDQVETLFKTQPGYVVTSTKMQDGVLMLEGLKDPAANSVEKVLTQHSVAVDKVQASFTPYQSLEPAIVLDRIRQQLSLDEQTGLSMKDNELQVTGIISNEQGAWLQNLPETHVLIESIDMNGTRLQAVDAVEIIKSGLEAPETIDFIAAGEKMAVSGLAPAEWYLSATKAEVYTGGWQLDFAPLRENLAARLAGLVEELNSSVFLFQSGVRLTSQSQSAIEATALSLAELQSLSFVLEESVNVTFEGLGDGIDTQEKNRAIAQKRTDQVLRLMSEYGVDPAGISHVMGKWEEGGLNFDRRKVTILIQHEMKQ